MKERDRYLKIVEWSEEDQSYVGSVPGWIGKCCHGDSEEKVYKELCQIVDEWIEIYKTGSMALPPSTSEKKYSGKFVMRIDPELHKMLTVKALNAGESLNNYCRKLLRNSASAQL